MTGKKATRATSNVFAMFEQKQIAEFKEAFGLFDNDKDGVINMTDLKEVYSNLGKIPKDAELKAMLDEASGPLNFTMMLSLFGDRLGGTDEESVLLNAFKMYDPEAKGTVHKDALREILVYQGRPIDRLSDQEFNQVFEGAPMDPKGHLDYAGFTKIVKRGKKDDE